MPHGICIIPWIIQCTRRILHVVPIMLYWLAFCGWLILYLVVLAVSSCSQILQICACKLIGGDEFLISLVDLYWLLPAVVICPAIVGVSFYLRCIVPLWNVFWTSGWISLHCFPCCCFWGTNYYLMSMVAITIFKAVDSSLSMNWNPGLIPQLFNYVVNSMKAPIISLSLLFFIAVARI